MYEHSHRLHWNGPTDICMYWKDTREQNIAEWTNRCMYRTDTTEGQNEEHCFLKTSVANIHLFTNVSLSFSLSFSSFANTFFLRLNTKALFPQG